MLHGVFPVWLLSLATQIVASGPLPNSTFTNPILSGFHPDPSCVFVPELDETFFCATSSFNAFPGLPIHASKDLQHWKLIGNALNREGQLPQLATVNSSTGGIWAPTLRYESGTFWLVTTLVFDDYGQQDPKRWDNIIFKSKDPFDETTWSDAVHFDFQGYDPSPFWDDNGDVYMVGAHAWQVYPAIQLSKVDLDTGETGEWQTLWNGTGGLAPEGPHLYFKDSMYYLVISEGGTGEGHMETIARSSHLTGPYTANPANPIMTAANTTRFFQAVGHADLFQDANDEWWAVALAIREDSTHLYHPMGRETVLTPVTWGEGEWPVVSIVEGVMDGWWRPSSTDVNGDGPWIGDADNLDFSSDSSLPRHFTHWRTPQNDDVYTISPPDHLSTLRLSPSSANLTYNGASAPPGGLTFVGRRQAHTLFTYSVNLEYTPTSMNEEAGVTVFNQQNRHVDLGLVLLAPGKLSFRVRGTSRDGIVPAYQTDVPSAWVNQTLRFEIKAFNWTHYALSVGPASSLSAMRTLAYPINSALSGGFSGTFLGIYATSNGGDGVTPAYFSNWTYTPEGQFVD